MTITKKQGGGRRPVGVQAMTASESQKRERERNRRQAQALDIIMNIVEESQAEIDEYVKESACELDVSEELELCSIRIKFITKWAKTGTDQLDEDEAEVVNDISARHKSA